MRNQGQLEVDEYIVKKKRITIKHRIARNFIPAQERERERE